MNPSIWGSAAAGVAGIVTAAYLASITIDDGLEALVFLPVLGGLLALAGLRAGWRGHAIAWPVQAGLAATGATLAAVLIVALATSDPMLFGAAIGASVVVATFAVTGALVGWGAGALLSPT